MSNTHGEWLDKIRGRNKKERNTMSRMIDAEALKEYIRSACEEMKCLFKDGGELAKIVTESFCKDIDEQPTIEPQQWIPCGERLPEDDADILVTYVDGEEVKISPVNYAKGTWFDCIFNAKLNPLKILAWMPLPEPYKGGKEHG